jgi:ribosome biogenesis SPOUT family RNA methylase Rps3
LAVRKRHLGQESFSAVAAAAVAAVVAEAVAEAAEEGRNCLARKALVAFLEASVA